MTPQERQTWVRLMGARGEWWTRQPEAVIEPAWEIVDAHCHLWDERHLPDPQDGALSLRTSRYLLDEFLRDAGSGHRVTAFVYIECGSRWYGGGPEPLRPVGETGFAAGLAEELMARDSTPALAGIVAHADLRTPDLAAVLDVHETAGAGRLRGIRHSGARLDDPAARLIAGAAPPGLYRDPDFRRGLALLGERGLPFDAFQFHFQLAELAELARATPGTTIVVDHLGAPVGFSRDAAAEAAVFTAWADGVDRLSDLPNVFMKLGGMASIVTGYDGHLRDSPPSSQAFVAERGAYFHHAIARFGAERCLFESNFPVDGASIGYRVLWNAYKTIAADYPAADRQALLAGTARRVYRLQPAPSEEPCTE